MVGVGEHEEYILEDWDEELLEESTGSSGVRFCDVGDQLQTHVETGMFDLSIIVLASPHARIDDKFELSVVEFEECGEAVKIDCSEEAEEFNTMFWEF